MKTLLKDTFRTIKSSKGRFISIVLIIALGTGFFSGLKATEPDMKNTADKHFEKYNLMDYWIVSTMGFDEDDVEAIKREKEVKKVLPTYSQDVILQRGQEDVVTKLMAIPKDYENNLNKPILVEGKMPENANECVLEAHPNLMKDYKIGSKIKIDSGTETNILENIKRDEYEVVGFVNSPLHITYERGTSKIGTGKVSTFIMIQESEFKYDYYTDIYLAMKGDFNTFSDEYKEYLEKNKEKLETLGEERQILRLDGIKEELEEKLKEGKEELEKGRREGEEKLEKARRDLEKGEDDLIKGEALYKEGNKTLEGEIALATERLKLEEKRLIEGKKEYEKNLKDFEESLPRIEREIEEGERKLQEGEKALSDLESNISNLKAELESLETEEEIITMEGNIKALEEEYNKNKIALEASKKEIEGAKNQINQSRTELKIVEERISKGERDIQSGIKTLKTQEIEGKERLKKEKEKLEKGRRELEKGKNEYVEKRIKFLEEISEGERELKKLDREIKKLEKPDWYIFSRDETRDYIEYEMGANRISSVSKVFPVFFFLIALLVSLTTMTRMIDEERSYIGTLKSLGYSNGAIMSKYLMYSLLASLLGSIIGLLVGFQVFPTVIYNAYRIMFIMPEIQTEFIKEYAINSTLVAVITTSLATYLSVRKDLEEVTANLLRPKAPKPGKRILLERIEPIWKRFSFSQKVTARNIFRYKRRLFMTVIGIAGCTALLVAGFGLKDSIMDITDNQYEDIFNFDLNVNINDGIIDRNLDPVIKYLEDRDGIEDYILTREEIGEVVKEDKKEEVNFVVFEDGKEINNFIKMRDRETGKSHKLGTNEVIITEKLGILLDIEKGDTITLRINDKDYDLKVQDIAENYAFHYVYMSETLYGRVFYENVKFNKILASTNNQSKDFEDEISKEILDIDDVSSIGFITGLSDSLKDTMGSLNYVIIVLIITAGTLAFVVLYNLININISERTREIATIKVLGFYDKEVSNYVFRENNILTILGTFFGLFVGFILHKFIIDTVEIDMIMFGRDVKFISYIYSSILTIVFSSIVNFTMHYKLKEIDMVESLKEIE